MEVNNKQPYVTPATEILEVKNEGIICASKDGYDPIPF